MRPVGIFKVSSACVYIVVRTRLAAACQLPLWLALQGVIRVIKSQNEAPLIDLSALLTPVTYLVRVYCLNVVGLQPLNGDGSCNPYLKIRLGNKTVSDKANVQHGTTDPELYKCYEVGAVLPGPGELGIEMWDHNRITSDEPIARTVIDLEDRWFSQRWQVRAHARHGS